MVVCLTGPIAAGKNAASDALSQCGFMCIDADVVAHKVIEQKTPLIIRTFSEAAQKAGVAIIGENGALNRQALGSLLFGQSELLRMQENIVYPAINAELAAFIDSAEKMRKNACINATLLYKSPEIMQKCNITLYIDCPKVIRFFRIRKRNPAWSKREILARFAAQSQLFAHYSAENADTYRVWNVGLRATLGKKITRLVRRQNGMFPV